MKKSVKDAILALALFIPIITTSACSGTASQSAPTNGGNASASDGTGGGGGTSGDGSSNSGPITNNRVVLTDTVGGGPVSPISFGLIPRLTSKTMQFEIVDYYFSADSIKIFSITTSHTDLFSPGADSCSGHSLQHGQSCTFQITFTPQANENYSAMLIITGDPPNIGSRLPSLEGSGGILTNFSPTQVASRSNSPAKTSSSPAPSSSSSSG